MWRDWKKNGAGGGSSWGSTRVLRVSWVLACRSEWTHFRMIQETLDIEGPSKELGVLCGEWVENTWRKKLGCEWHHGCDERLCIFCMKSMRCL